MAKFNEKKQEAVIKTVNKAGGEAYSQSAELEMVSILLTSFVEDSYYEKAGQNLDRLKAVIGKVNPLFAAKAAVYARKEFGMRSITHVLASELAKRVSGEPWAKKFYYTLVNRPDDMIETIAYYFKQGNKTLSKSMQKGFAEAFSNFDAYQLAKYKMGTKSISLVDVVNLVHPVPCERNGYVEVSKSDYLSLLQGKLKGLSRKNVERNSKKIEKVKESIESITKSEKDTVRISALEALMSGLLKNTETTEAKMSLVGQKASSEKEKSEMKTKVWESQLNSGKMPYFNLLRNLRNIIQEAPLQVDKACELLTNEKSIKKSLVLPFRYDTAIQEIEAMSSSKETMKVIVALNKAVDISCSNVPKFDGDTLVVLDVSASMEGKPSKIGALFSAILVKSNYADFVTFDNYARYCKINPADSTLSVAKSMRFNGGGTNLSSVFDVINKKYDRIIILSDQQNWIGRDCPDREFKTYKTKFGCNPYIYSFDLKGYGTMQFPESKVYAIAGFSEKVFDVMKTFEEDKNSLVKTINNYISF